MAVEARHLSLFPSQIPSNREMGSFVEGNGNLYAGHMGGYRGVPGPLSGTTTATDALIPMYGSAMADSVPAKTPIKSDSGLSYAIPASRKRSREAVISHHPMLSFQPNLRNQQQTDNRCGSFTFMGEDISYQIQQQQLEIDNFIAEHTEKVRMEIEERRKRYSRRIIAAVEESIVNKLRAKEVEIEKMGKLNWALEERVKSLCLENQIWRDLAQTNEATANALRTNLEQVLAQVQDDQDQRQQHQRNENGNGEANAAALMEDAESCCGSNYAEEANSMKDSRECQSSKGGNGQQGNFEIYNGNGGIRLCRNCGKEEPNVLLLPCRHLCLCSVCGPSLHTCPVCKCTKNATLHVNLSSS